MNSILINNHPHLVLLFFRPPASKSASHASCSHSLVQHLHRRLLLSPFRTTWTLLVFVYLFIWLLVYFWNFYLTHVSPISSFISSDQWFSTSKELLIMSSQWFEIQWKLLNVITLGSRETDLVIQMKTISKSTAYLSSL